MDNNLLALLRCPIDEAALQLSADGLWLVNALAGRRYPIEDGIAMLLPEQAQAVLQLEQKDESGHESN